MQRKILLQMIAAYCVIYLTSPVEGKKSEELNRCLNGDASPRSKFLKWGNSRIHISKPISTFLTPPDVFGLKLFQSLGTKISHMNIIISPFSIYSVLLLGYYGSMGRTQQQLSKVLGVTNKVTTFYTRQKLNALLSDTPSEKAVLHLNNKGYFASSLSVKNCVSDLIPNLKKIDFNDGVAAANKINSDVEKDTEGMIKEIVSSEELQDASFLLINAVYFKGIWKEHFDALATKKMDFFGSDNKVIGQVDMMFDDNRLGMVADIPELKAEMVELPYADSSVSMVLFHPKEREHGNIDKILKGLTPNLITKAITNMEETNFKLQLPKFKLETRISDVLLKELQSLGITDLFDENLANLTAFTSQPLYVKDVIHKAVILVNEDGTEAAAATAMEGMSRSAVLPPLLEIYFNHPFVYMVYDKDANVILFAGTFRDPKSIEQVNS